MSLVGIKRDHRPLASSPSAGIQLDLQDPPCPRQEALTSVRAAGPPPDPCLKTIIPGPTPVPVARSTAGAEASRFSMALAIPCSDPVSTLSSRKLFTMCSRADGPTAAKSPAPSPPFANGPEPSCSGGNFALWGYAHCLVSRRLSTALLPCGLEMG